MVVHGWGEESIRLKVIENTIKIKNGAETFSGHTHTHTEADFHTVVHPATRSTADTMVRKKCSLWHVGRGGGVVNGCPHGGELINV